MKQNSDIYEMSALVLAPSGQDGKLAQSVLENAEIKSENISTVEKLYERLDLPCGCLLIAEEAISAKVLDRLTKKLSEQEPWSDLPIILLSSNSKKFDHTRKIVEHFGSLANITLLERPFSVITLITMTKVALRSRHKQYQVRDLLQEMNRTLRIRDEFISIASHELKTPITTISLQTQMKKRFMKKSDYGFNQDKVKDFIDLIDKQSNRISRLVDDMLDVSRIENGKLSIKPELCDLNSIISQVLEGFRAEVDSGRIEVSLEENQKLLGYWDKFRIEQVIVNLISNAIKYGNGNPVLLSSLIDDNKVVLQVKDQGMGISEEDLERIFQRFERAVSGGNISGLGLGLFISRQIVELHEGTLSVQSTIGQGSVFKLELPLAKELV